MNPFCALAVACFAAVSMLAAATSARQDDVREGFTCLLASGVFAWAAILLATM